MVFGRVCLIGDAAFAARPHAAAGTAKAASDAWALADALPDADGDVVTAVQKWEPGRLEVGRNPLTRVREMGRHYQVDSDADPVDRNLRFGLYGRSADRRHGRGAQTMTRYSVRTAVPVRSGTRP